MRSILLVLLLSISALAQTQRWTEAKAADWYAKQPWLVGSNYIPATAINELEMWQAGTFDPKRIDLELGWAESLGMNTMRVFLHDLLWKQDAAGFKQRIDAFLKIASKHGIRPMFVLFDSCWDPLPKLGKQRDPKPGVHNSGWVQSPGAEALGDPSQYPRLEAYVKGVVGAFAKDRAGQHKRIELRKARSAEQGSIGAGTSTESVRVGPCGRRRAAFDERSVEGRLVQRGQAFANGESSIGLLRRDLVSQL